jgi:glycerate 2-kinase
MSARHTLLHLFDAAIAEADPLDPTRDVLGARLAERSDAQRGWIIAVGKGAGRMAKGARLAAADTDLELAGTLIVAHEAVVVPPDAPCEALISDHPVPGPLARHAAQRLGVFTNAVLPGDHVLLAISGGTSSLLAAPVDGVSDAALDDLWRLLLGAGAATDVRVMNTIRRRFLRWGGGRLAKALEGARLHQVLLSDVVGDDPAIIGSGPATPDATRATDILAMLREHHLLTRIDAGIVAYLNDVMAGLRPETPKPFDPAFQSVDPPIVLGRGRLHDGVVRAAKAAGHPVMLHRNPLVGPASTAGRALAHALAESLAPGIHCWTGETTVALGSNHGRGGRSQELALSAALSLSRLGPAGQRVTLLAAGTDGRDGPTDAAGAVVDAETVARIVAGGIDPDVALARHDAYPALDAAQALIRTGATGTNVADIVLAMVG